MYKILIVDDEPDILDLLKYNLEKEGYEILTASDGKEGVELANTFQPHVILMDIMMPGLDGIEACRRVRQNPLLADTFILFLTARSEEYSEIAAFDSGANDFVTKPVKPRALVSRISAFFRRESAPGKDAVLKYKDLRIDRESHTVMKGEQKILLPRKEFELLFFLMQHPNVVYTRDDLLRNVWGTDVYVVARTIDVHIRKLREKIGEDTIKTVKGIGYKFDTSDD